MVPSNHILMPSDGIAGTSRELYLTFPNQHLCIRLRSNLYISRSLRLCLRMMRHLCLGHHLSVILTLYILNCCMEIRNNCLIVKISGSSIINSRPSMLDTVGCTKQLGWHPPPMKTGQGSSSCSDMRVINVLCPHRSLRCSIYNSVTLRRSNRLV